MELQQLYFSAPVWLQNVLVSGYGFHQKRKRYGGDYTNVYKQVQQLRTFSAEAIAQYQNERFLRILRHCYDNVPYYRHLFQSHRLTLQDFKGIEDINKLPILEKETARTQQKELRAPGQKIYWKQHTSGSTGTPLTIYLNQYTYQLSMALLWDHESTHGVRPHDVKATFAGRMVQPIENQQPPFWRYNRADHQMLFSSYHLSEANMPHYLRELERLQPEEIIGYPSAIYAVAEYCLRMKTRPNIRPTVVVTNSETLFSWQRSAMEQAFGCPVADYYGSAECVVFAGQCKHGAYHFNPLLSIVEIGKDNLLVSPGEQGRLVLTSLTNDVMPLLRYEIGDDAIAVVNQCACGLPYPAVQAIVGRTDDNIITPDGRAIGRIDHIFKGVNGIRECQVIQESLRRITLNIISDVDFDETHKMELTKNLRERVGHNFEIQLQEVSYIPRTSRGKFKGVVNCMQEMTPGAPEK